MPETTEPQLTESEVEDLLRVAGNGSLQFPLRVEGWHKSLTDGGWFIRQSSGRIVMTVAFVPAETESGIPAREGNAPARTAVALLNSVPALIRDWGALRAQLSLVDSQAAGGGLQEKVFLSTAKEIIKTHAHETRAVGHTDCNACLDADANAVASIVSAQSNAATAMRDKCVELLERAAPALNAAVDSATIGPIMLDLIEKMESLTLDSVEQKQ